MHWCKALNYSPSIIRIAGTTSLLIIYPNSATFYTMIKFKHFPLLIFFWFVFAKNTNGQEQTLDDVRLNFSIRWEQNIDSAYIDPGGVIGFIFYDSCYSQKFANDFSILADSMTSLRYIRIDGTSCFQTNDTIVYALFKFRNLNTIFDRWGECFKYYSINYPERFKQMIINLETRCPDSVNSKEWQSRIYNFTNLNDLSLNFAKSTTIIPEITRLANLRGLQLFSLGDIQFPENFHEMKNLKEIDMSNCINCKSFPDQLPTSIEKINIFTTNISTLPSNLSDLRNLTHLNIACSKIKVFPKNFNFKQLHYFFAEESLFTPDEWERIKKDVFTVVTSCSSKGKSTLPKRG